MCPGGIVMRRQLLVGSLVLALASGSGVTLAAQARARGGGSGGSSGQSSGGGHHAVPRSGGSAPHGGSVGASAPRSAPASAPAGARSQPSTASGGRYTGGNGQAVYTGGYARSRDGRYVTG